MTADTTATAGGSPAAGPFIRTVLGEVDVAAMGVTYAHEHLVIDGGRPVELFADLLLDDVGKMADEVLSAMELGLQTVVDAMPADAGRNARKLAELSRRTGLNIVAPTGLHHARFYPVDHWSTRASVPEIAELFVADITEGIDERDYSGPIVIRTDHRAGVIKIAGSEGGPSPRDERVFAAAALAHERTGVPILTHCEQGTGALEQVRLLVELGVPTSHMVVSHVDKVVDRSYHREIAATGAFSEYDQAFRWADQPNGTLQLLDWMAEDGQMDQIVLGMDAARRGYLRAYGGQPGLTYLLGEFSREMGEHGHDAIAHRRLFVDNPARAFAFVPAAAGTAR